MSKYTPLFILAIIALLALFTVAQGTDNETPPVDEEVDPVTPPVDEEVDPVTPPVDGEPDPIAPPVLDDYALLAFSMRLPSGFEIYELQEEMDKLHEKCGEQFGLNHLIKDGSGERNFTIYVPLSLNETYSFDTYSTECFAAYEKRKDDLKRRGRVEIHNITHVQLEEQCATTCGVEPCPVCSLLATCTTDAECGPHALCAVSQRDPSTNWCLSSNAFITTTMVAAIIAFATMLF